jgi:hypothetical protein
MARKNSFKIPGVSFSAKRALGITRAKQKLARKTGIPLTKSGRQSKIGQAVTGGGCLLYVLSFIGLCGVLVALITANIG